MRAALIVSAVEKCGLIGRAVFCSVACVVTLRPSVPLLIVNVSISTGVGKKVGKIKRLKKLLSKYPLRKNKAISKQNSPIKNSEDTQTEEGSIVKIPEKQEVQESEEKE